VNLQVDEDLLASLNSLGARTSIASFIDVILRAKVMDKRKNVLVKHCEISNLLKP